MLIKAQIIERLPVEDYKVSSASDHKRIASAISNSFKNCKGQVISAIGAGAVNCAVKACATTRGNITKGPSGIGDLLVRLSWFDAESDTNSKLSGIRIEPIYVMQLTEEEE